MGSGYDLVADFNDAVAAIPAGTLSPTFYSFKRFFLSEVHILSAFPDQTRNVALRMPFSNPVCQATLALPLASPLLQLINKHDSE